MLAMTAGVAFAADEGGSAAAKTGGTDAKFVLIWALAFVASIVALVQAFFFYKSMKQADPGNERMVEIAGYVRDGANAYLKQQYIVVAGFFVVIGLLLAVAAFGLNVQSKFVPFAFLTGGFFSGLAGWFGMKTATMASSRRPGCTRSSMAEAKCAPMEARRCRSGAIDTEQMRFGGFLCP